MVVADSSIPKSCNRIDKCFKVTAAWPSFARLEMQIHIQPIMGNLTLRWPLYMNRIVVLEGQQEFTLLTHLPRDSQMSFILGMGAFTY